MALVEQASDQLYVRPRLCASQKDLIPTICSYILQYYSLAAFSRPTRLSHKLIHTEFRSAILYYDHIVTFSAEVRYIWQKPLSRSSLIFFLNRYVICFGYIPVLLFLFFSPEDIDVRAVLPSLLHDSDY